ncbi:MAG: hypothetical protein AAGG02_15945 [Cyanobacteria bacterium P01_H01_bin.15]
MMKFQNLLVCLGMGSALLLGMTPANAQSSSSAYTRCFALRIDTIGFDEFVKNDADNEESVLLPPGWSPVAITNSAKAGIGGGRKPIVLACGQIEYDPVQLEQRWKETVEAND